MRAKMEALSTSFAHNPTRNAPTIANIQMHKVVETIIVT
jgi:hypothetical protein